MYRAYDIVATVEDAGVGYILGAVVFLGVYDRYFKIETFFIQLFGCHKGAAVEIHVVHIAPVAFHGAVQRKYEGNGHRRIFDVWAVRQGGKDFLFLPRHGRLRGFGADASGDYGFNLGNESGLRDFQFLPLPYVYAFESVELNEQFFAYLVFFRYGLQVFIPFYRVRVVIYPVESVGRGFHGFGRRSGNPDGILYLCRLLSGRYEDDASGFQLSVRAYAGVGLQYVFRLYAVCLAYRIQRLLLYYFVRIICFTPDSYFFRGHRDRRCFIYLRPGGFERKQEQR